MIPAPIPAFLVDAGGQPWMSLEFRLVIAESGQPRAKAILPETRPKRKAASLDSHPQRTLKENHSLALGYSYEGDAVRNTLVQFAYQQPFTAEQMKALSQNLGYESPMTTFGSYGPLTRDRQGEVIAGVGRQPGGVDLSQSTPVELARALSAKLGAG